MPCKLVHAVYSCHEKRITRSFQSNCFSFLLNRLIFLAWQEENKILDKLHRQKIAEVEKLSQTVRDLEEAVLQGGVKANVIRDYERRFQEMSVIIYP